MRPQGYTNTNGVSVTKCPVGYAYGYEGQALPDDVRDTHVVMSVSKEIRGELEALRFNSFVQPTMMK